MAKKTKIRILYIEGFSPGPGLPFPLLASLGKYARANKNVDIEVVKRRMPYGCSDHVKNPFVYLLLLFVFSLFVVWLPWLTTSDNLSIIGKAFMCSLLFLFSLYMAYLLKQRLVAHCLHRCIDTFRRCLLEEELDIDVVIGYSWGGGILTFLIALGLWRGHSILIAPAGELMAEHAGMHHLVTLAPLSAAAAVDDDDDDGDAVVVGNEEGSKGERLLTIIHGTRDEVVPFEHSKKLLDTSRSSNSKSSNATLLTCHGEDHFLRKHVDVSFLVAQLEKCNLL